VPHSGLDTRGRGERSYPLFSNEEFGMAVERGIKAKLRYRWDEFLSVLAEDDG
jgi:hypothetical protein